MGEKLALVVGLNDYPGTNSDLTGCVNDANRWEQKLLSRGFKVTKLLDKDATRINIVKELESMVKNAPSFSRIVPTFSGHGSWVVDLDGDEADGRDECLCPYDIGILGIPALITDDTLFDIFSQKTYGTLINFISDSCHSGTVARFAPPLAGSTRRTRYLPPEHFLDTKEQKRARVLEQTKLLSKSRYQCILMAGCRDHEYSWDAVFNNTPQGAFSYAMLEVLDTYGNANPTYTELYKKVRDTLPSQSHPQTPQLEASARHKRMKIFE